MHFSRRFTLLFLGVPFAGILLCFHELPRLPDGRLHVSFMDVGQGDSALVTTPSGKRIVIDGGRDATALSELGKKMPLLNRTIDLLVLSHPDLDHVAAFPEIVRRYDVKRALITGVAGEAPPYEDFLKLLTEKRIPVTIADPSQDFDMGDGVVIDVIWPPPLLLGAHEEATNETSIVMRVLFEKTSILFTGDMGEPEERQALDSGGDLSANILKVGHHGSKGSSSTGFLLAVRPNVGVISVGRKNSYGHPHPLVMERFRVLGIPVRTTANEGSIELEY